MTQKLLPTFAISLFPEYLISIGVSRSSGLRLQVVAFPQGRGFNESESVELEQPSSGFVLAVDIPLLTFVPNQPQALPVICHNYKGRVKNRIGIWILEELETKWNIFEFDVDLSKAPGRWLTLYGDGKERAINGVEVMTAPKRVLCSRPEPFLDRARILADGKHFIVFKGPKMVDDNDYSVRLSMFNLDNIPPQDPLSTSPNSFTATDHYRQQFSSYPSSSMESSTEYPGNDDPPDLYRTEFQEWSGTASVIMENHDIWVMRYGYPRDGTWIFLHCLIPFSLF
jgi:hypothetical protein